MRARSVHHSDSVLELGLSGVGAQGSYSKLEAYSAFEAYLTEAIDPAEPPGTDGSATEPVILPEDTEVARYLREKGIGKVVIVGLATDYWCVCLSTPA